MKDFKVIDGGFGTELAKRGYSTDTPLWSAHFLSTNSPAILEIHKSYLRSGADIITTASYQASIEGFQKNLGITVDEAEELIIKSVALVKQACDDFKHENKVDEVKKKTIIAGSVGPYAIHLADGSEYSGNYIDNVTLEQLMDWHRPRIKCLVKAECDVLAFETIPAEKEGIALLKLLREFPNVKSWLSFCCQDPHLIAHKEEFSKVVRHCLQVAPPDQIVAVGTNCCPPDYVKSLLSDIDQLPPNIVKLAYPNSGEKWIGNEKEWEAEKDVKPISNYVLEWIAAGGQWLGGCCRTGPEDIAAISDIIRNIT